jgi:hypothetical protein
MADCLVKEIAKPARDSVTEVIRSADLIDYTAEEGLRALGEGQMLTSDSFPGQKRNKLCLVSKVREPTVPSLPVVLLVGLGVLTQVLRWACSQHSSVDRIDVVQLQAKMLIFEADEAHGHVCHSNNAAEVNLKKVKPE